MNVLHRRRSIIDSAMLPHMPVQHRANNAATGVQHEIHTPPPNVIPCTYVCRFSTHFNHAAMRCGKHASAQTQPAWVDIVLLDSCWTHCLAAGQPSPANNSRTFAGHLSRVKFGLLDTLSSSWTCAGQANPVNMLLLDTCWTHCPAAGHLLDSQVL